MHNTSAPGWPGIKPKWTSSSKSGIGKALDTASLVAFTLSHGIINEVYYPREDIACMRDMELIITNDADFFSEEKRDCSHTIKMIKPGVPAYKLVNTCLKDKYRITKEIIADPLRSTVLQKTTFTPKKKGPEQYHVHVLLAPHLNDHGNNNTGWTGEYNGVPMLYAYRDGLCLALSCSNKLLKRSVGFVGKSDGWTDLHLHNKMTWEYEKAEDGNVALMAEIDISENKEFTLAIGFGRNVQEASNHALGSLLDGYNYLEDQYTNKWQTWTKGLKNFTPKLYRISATVMRIHEAKNFPGGVLASLSVPWGETKSDKDTGGYHVVWPRDLVESAGGFLAINAVDDALRIVNYLMSTQKEDGSWPQNMWLEGEEHWKGLQIDQVAFPILIVGHCIRNKSMDADRIKRYWPRIKKAIAFLIYHGPFSQEDRWEEEKGYSTFTIAVSVAGMLAAADIAEINKDQELANYCREVADEWNSNIDKWTYVTGTSLAKEHGVDGYYIRINPYKNMAAQELTDESIDLKNHSNGEGNTKINELISVDALALVRFGLREANDPKILNTIKVIDALLKVDTPNGPCWHRYNNDGYGEKNNGQPYDGTGIGRAWPLLTGERGHYEVAAGNIPGAKKLLNAMEAFSSNGFISEQIWDTGDIPEKELYFGKPSGSAMPLTWAHAEYIKLCASIVGKKVFDMPPQTVDRYIKQNTLSGFSTWSFDIQIKKMASSKKLRIVAKAGAIIHWTDDNWKTSNTANMKENGISLFVADVDSQNENAKEIEFTFFWNKAKQWENKNFSVSIISDKPDD